jgi:hypothetical protein
MSVLIKTDWEILNATADDWENLEQIYRLIGHFDGPGSGRKPNLQEIADAVRSLVEQDLLAARLEDGTMIASRTPEVSYVWRAWFHMTPAGRNAWSAATPEALAT